MICLFLSPRVGTCLRITWNWSAPQLKSTLFWRSQASIPFRPRFGTRDLALPHLNIYTWRWYWKLITGAISLKMTDLRVIVNSEYQSFAQVTAAVLKAMQMLVMSNRNFAKMPQEFWTWIMLFNSTKIWPILLEIQVVRVKINGW